MTTARPAPLAPSEEHALEQQRARRGVLTSADLPLLRAVQDLLPILRDRTELDKRSQEVARQLDRLDERVGTDAFPTTGLSRGHQRSAAVLGAAQRKLCEFALDQGPVRSHEFRVTKRHVLKFLAEMLQRQARDVDNAAISVSYIRNRAGGNSIYARFVRPCCMRVNTGFRVSARYREVSTFNFYAVVLFIYRAMLSVEDEHLRRLLLRRTAFHFPFAHDHLVARATEIGPVADAVPDVAWDRERKRRAC